MGLLIKQVEAGFDAPHAGNATTLRATADSSARHRAKFPASYKRPVSSNAWRTEAIEDAIPPGGLAFFLGAQNDAPTPRALAGPGIWRPALESLRGGIESVLAAMYDEDHPAELPRRQNGGHGTRLTEMVEYSGTHPQLGKIRRDDTGPDLIGVRCATSSKAAPASAARFRMRAEGSGARLRSADPARRGKWAENEQDAVVGPNRRLIAPFREDPQAARLPRLRKAISMVIPARNPPAIRRKFGVSPLPSSYA